MLHEVEATLAGLRNVPCPGCTERALDRVGAASGSGHVHCAACGATFDVLAEVVVDGDQARLRGSFGAGWWRHTFRWHPDDAADEHVTTFQTWAQDHLRLLPGDRVSLLFPGGDLDREPTRRAPRIPLLVANHTRRRLWALVGSAPVLKLR